MVSWLLIGTLILLVFIIFKAKRVQHKIYIVVIVFLILFFYMTGSRFMAESNIDVKSLDGMIAASKLYFSWLGHVFDNTRVLIGNAIKMDWFGNSSITKIK